MNREDISLIAAERTPDMYASDGNCVFFWIYYRGAIAFVCSRPHYVPLRQWLTAFVLRDFFLKKVGIKVQVM